jgi:hypothetical protein
MSNAGAFPSLVVREPTPPSKEKTMQENTRHSRSFRMLCHCMAASLLACMASAPVLAQGETEKTATTASSGKLAESVHRLSPVDTDASMSVEAFARSAAANSTVCGLLQYHSDENGWFHFQGIANGSLIVNFSEGGVIRSRMQESIVNGAWHHYDTKNYRYQLGFTCL